MKVLSVAIVASALSALAGQVAQGPAAAAASDTSRNADRAAINKLHQQETGAMLSRDPVALTDLWTDDAIRLGPGQPAEAGTQAIRKSNERWSARAGVKVLTYVPETKDLTLLDDWAVEWGYFTASYIETPDGETKQIRGTRLAVLKKLTDGRWKYFRDMGTPVFRIPGGLTAPAGQVGQRPAAPAEGEMGGDADRAAIEKLHQQDAAATLSRDPVALTALWTDDAVRLGPGPPADVGKQAIRERNERASARPGFKVLTYVRETKDLKILNGWAIEWHSYTASYVESADGEAKQVRGTVLSVLKKLQDGSWKAFRGMGMQE